MEKQDPTKTKRLQMRANSENKDIERTETSAGHETLVLNQRDSRLFFDIIAHPPAANHAFKKAARAYSQLKCQADGQIKPW